MELSLVSRKCIPCEIGTPPMTPSQAQMLLGEVKDWELKEENSKNGKTISKIQKKLKFKDFRESLLFVNKIGKLSEAEGHHPDIFISFSRVTLTLWTHAAQGLTENDFVMAAKIDQALNNFSI